jgi:hypothetical protein
MPVENRENFRHFLRTNFLKKAGLFTPVYIAGEPDKKIICKVSLATKVQEPSIPFFRLSIFKN